MFEQQLILFNESSKRIVSKSKKLGLSRVDFTLNEHKIFNAFLSLINPTAAYNDKYLTVKLLRHEIAELTGIHPQLVHKMATDCSRKFIKAEFEFQKGEQGQEDYEFETFNLMDKASYKERTGEFCISFAPTAMKEIVDLAKSQYGSFMLQNQDLISSKYGVILTDILSASWHSKAGAYQKIKLDLNRLKWQFGIASKDGTPKYKSYAGLKEFNRRVLIPAIESVNNVKDFYVDKKKIKKVQVGRKITHLILEVSRNTKTATNQSDSVVDRLREHGLSYDEVREVIVLANNVAVVFSDDASKELLELLDENLSIDEFEERQSTLENKDVEMLIRLSINYVEKRNGIKNFHQYLLKTIKNMYAVLPNWANPKSPMYDGESQLIKNFVKQKVLPKAVSIEKAARSDRLEKEMYLDIVENGAFSYYFEDARRDYLARRSV